MSMSSDRSVYLANRLKRLEAIRDALDPDGSADELQQLNKVQSTIQKIYQELSRLENPQRLPSAASSSYALFPPNQIQSVDQNPELENTVMAIVIIDYKAYNAFLSQGAHAGFLTIDRTTLPILIEKIRAYTQDELHAEKTKIFLYGDSLEMGAELNEDIQNLLPVTLIEDYFIEEYSKIFAAIDAASFNKDSDHVVLIGNTGASNLSQQLEQKYNSCKIINPEIHTPIIRQKISGLNKRNLHIFIDWQSVHVPKQYVHPFLDGLLDYTSESLQYPIELNRPEREPDLRNREGQIVAQEKLKSIEIILVINTNNYERDKEKLREIQAEFQRYRRYYQGDLLVKIVDSRTEDTKIQDLINQCQSGDIIHLVSHNSDFSKVLGLKVLDNCKIIITFGSQIREVFKSNPMWYSTKDFIEMPKLEAYKSEKVADRAARKRGGGGPH